MPKKSSIIDHLKSTSGPIRAVPTGRASQRSSIDYYRFGKADVEKALEKAVEELEQELVEECGNSPVYERDQVAVRDGKPNEMAMLRPLIDELKSTLMQGFEQAIAKTSTPSDTSFNEQLLGEIRKLPKEAPAPRVEVNIPEQPKVAPVRRVRATNIVRDEEGNISGAEFEVER